MTEIEKEKKFEDEFKENFSKEQRREVVKTVLKFYGNIPIKSIKKTSGIAIKHLKAFGKRFVIELKSLGSFMNTKLKENKISDFFKKDTKKEEE